MAVADSSVIITLAKIKELELLARTFTQVIIGPAVRAEVVDKGRSMGAPEISRIVHVLNSGWLKMVRLSKAEQSIVQVLQEQTTLHMGEIESLALAQARRQPLIVDDLEARAVARTIGVQHMGTAGVLLEAYLRKEVSFAELEDLLDRLSNVLWLAPNVVADILKQAREER
jgi:hypothetical protein